MGDCILSVWIVFCKCCTFDYLRIYIPTGFVCIYMIHPHVCTHHLAIIVFLQLLERAALHIMYIHRYSHLSYQYICMQTMMPH